MANILLVDDNEDVHIVIKALLGDAHSVTTAATVAQLLEFLADGYKPEVAFIDFTLDTYDGSDVARMVRRQCPDAKIVAFTAHSEDWVQAEDWADKFVSKGSLTKLNEVISELV